ncbi:MAG TPA: ABC transporter substrate-binding protein [Alphaproteobacteria bacterium]|nr:ABC transporter substrate-binding protein [Alphaproteobacteria bacterium]
MRFGRFILVMAVCVMAALGGPASAADGWDKTLSSARGKEVYWNAWAGDPSVNAYIAWVADEVRRRFDITLHHVKIGDTAEAVSRVLAEAAAGRKVGGSVDLIWINGENFLALKESGLLYGPFAQSLPNYSLVDTEAKPTTRIDATVPTEGYESPWGSAQFVMIVDSARVQMPPAGVAELLAWAQANPGRLTYPLPPDFIGTTFLKQALYELNPESLTILQQPLDGADFETVTAPLWAYLDALHPHLWRAGKGFPRNGPAARRLIADGEADIAFSFQPSEASAAIAQGLLPETARTAAFAAGSIGNSHFLAIPANASQPEAALVVADFLLSPEAQARKQDPGVWGDFTVLALRRLDPADRERFESLPLGPATLPPDKLGPTFPEPHPSWTVRMEQEWQRRYGR